MAGSKSFSRLSTKHVLNVARSFVASKYSPAKALSERQFKKLVEKAPVPFSPKVRYQKTVSKHEAGVFLGNLLKHVHGQAGHVVLSSKARQELNIPGGTAGQKEFSASQVKAFGVKAGRLTEKQMAQDTVKAEPAAPSLRDQRIQQMRASFNPAAQAVRTERGGAEALGPKVSITPKAQALAGGVGAAAAFKTGRPTATPLASAASTPAATAARAAVPIAPLPGGMQASGGSVARPAPIGSSGRENAAAPLARSVPAEGAAANPLSDKYQDEKSSTPAEPNAPPTDADGTAEDINSGLPFVE